MEPAKTKSDWVDYTYTIDEKIQYKKIYQIEGDSVKGMKKSVKKIMALGEFKKVYEGEDEILAMGKLTDLKYQGYWLFGHNTKFYNCVYDLKVSFKPDKVRIIATDINLLPKNISITTQSWWGGGKEGFGSAITKTEIPTDIPTEKIESFYPEKTDPKNYIFQSLSREMTKVFTRFEESLRGKDDDW